MSLLLEVLMPKVNEQYFEQKKQEILEAAFRVIQKKPMYQITMMDIISESGLSKGGIYRYYANVDDVLIALLNQDSENSEFPVRLEEIANSGRVPEKVIKEFFNLYKELTFDGVMGTGKIAYGLDNMYVYEPERYEVFAENFVYFKLSWDFLGAYRNYIQQKVEGGYFKPTMELEEIFNFVKIAMYGAINDHSVEGGNIDNFINSLYVAMITLLGGKICAE
jgi:AcrR family transcriptional regulator